MQKVNWATLTVYIFFGFSLFFGLLFFLDGIGINIVSIIKEILDPAFTGTWYLVSDKIGMSALVLGIVLIVISLAMIVFAGYVNKKGSKMLNLALAIAFAVFAVISLISFFWAGADIVPNKFSIILDALIPIACIVYATLKQFAVAFNKK